MQQPEIDGWGADADPAKRPGVPEDRHPPKPLIDIRGFPSQQQAGYATAQSRYRPVTRVYGTVVPPRGLSGVLRRFAYRLPDYEASRWVMLKLADRVDVIEHNAWPLTLGLGTIAVAAIGIRRLSRR